MKTNDHNQKFPGFPEKPYENYWQYPKMMNGYWHELSGTEQKVLDYILRHTWGYQKMSDKISLSQFTEGIKNKKTGKWVDKGIGIRNKNTILKAIKKLEKIGFIKTSQFFGKPKEISLVTNGDNTSNQQLQVGSYRKLHTIDNNTINNKQYSLLSNEEKIRAYKNSERWNERPCYKNNPMRYSSAKDKWEVLEQGEWIEFGGQGDDIEWKKKNKY